MSLCYILSQHVAQFTIVWRIPSSPTWPPLTHVLRFSWWWPIFSSTTRGKPSVRPISPISCCADCGTQRCLYGECCCRQRTAFWLWHSSVIQASYIRCGTGHHSPERRWCKQCWLNHRIERYLNSPHCPVVAIVHVDVNPKQEKLCVCVCITQPFADGHKCTSYALVDIKSVQA